MAPPTRLNRPHLNDLLQKNLELEHVVADLRHQLTQSAAKWADERKLLATGCDTLMASFSKFRARLDVHPSERSDSEGEVEQSLDAGEQGEEAGDVGNETLEAEGVQESTVEENLREKCESLVAEVQAKGEELEESRRKHEAAEGELQRVRRSLEAQGERLREALASANADIVRKSSSAERIPGDLSTQADHPEPELQDRLKKLDLANQEINRLKQLVQQWQKYGNEWKREAQIMQVHASELQLRELELSARIRAAEGPMTLPEAEMRQEVQRLTSALADQTASVEQQRNASQESLKRVHDLETMVTLLRAQLSPEQLASFEFAQSQSAPRPSNSVQLQTIQSPTPQADANTNNHIDMTLLKTPYRPMRKSPSGENIGTQEEQRAVSSSPQAPASASVPASPEPQISNSTPDINAADCELCIHTCNPHLCRNGSQSFLWPRRLASLPRHALSAKKHRHCTTNCPGYRLLSMPVEDAVRQPRRAKCRPPTEEELTLAAEEACRLSANGQLSERGTGAEGENGREGSGEPEEFEEPGEGLTRQEEAAQEKVGEPSRQNTEILRPGKRPRSGPIDGEEQQRVRKLRPRAS